jgi:hypothetical protein
MSLSYDSSDEEWDLQEGEDIAIPFRQKKKKKRDWPALLHHTI